MVARSVADSLSNIGEAPLTRSGEPAGALRGALYRIKQLSRKEATFEILPSTSYQLLYIRYPLTTPLSISSFSC